MKSTWAIVFISIKIITNLSLKAGRTLDETLRQFLMLRKRLFKIFIQKAWQNNFCDLSDSERQTEVILTSTMAMLLLECVDWLDWTSVAIFRSVGEFIRSQNVLSGGNIDPLPRRGLIRFGISKLLSTIFNKFSPFIPLYLLLSKIPLEIQIEQDRVRKLCGERKLGGK